MTLSTTTPQDVKDDNEINTGGRGLHAGAGTILNDDGKVMDDDESQSDDDNNNQAHGNPVSRLCKPKGPMGICGPQGPMG